MVKFLKIEVRMSPDGGQTWVNHHAFDAFSEHTGFVVVGGDNRSVHIAFIRMSEEGRPTLVVRSFARGEWEKDPHTPDWFKEQKLPEASEDSF